MSLSASAENLTSETQNYDGSSSMCLELALEGERLCKAGDCRAGVAFFQAAIQAGTDDLRTLSAIYSQLGNAYFYLGDYPKAMQYHKHDLTLARTMGDKLGEAKSSGNLGNTLKVMGRFDEAVLCCKRHLELSRELGDRLSEGRALYNLGNVYHAKGKHIGRVGHQDPGEFPEDVKSCLQQAVTYYEENLTLMRELGDVAAEGRACGNLGNTHYLLGDFAQAIRYHEERLAIARQFGDRAAERRAHSNLGNSQIFLGQFEEAAHHYKRTLVLAQELGDRAVEAQACYSLGNTYTLLRDYETAIEYHLRHLMIAQHLGDRVGEGRACWSLGNAHAALSNHEKALYFATKHLEISKELDDPMGQATAKMNMADLRKVLGLTDSSPDDGSSAKSPETSEQSATPIPSLGSGGTGNRTVDGRDNSDGIPTPSGGGSSSSSVTTIAAAATASGISQAQVSLSTVRSTNNTSTGSSNQNSRIFRARRESMERLSLIKLTPDGKQRPQNNKLSANGSTSCSSSSGGGGSTGSNSAGGSTGNNTGNIMIHNKIPSSPAKGGEEEDNFFDLLSKFQSKRMDDQRCSLQVDNKENTNATLNIPNGNNNNNSHNHNNNNNNNTNNNNNNNNTIHNERPDDLLDMIVGMQSKRMDEQRVALPHLPGLQSSSLQRLADSAAANVAPDDAFLEMLARCQGSRLEDQRSPLPVTSVPVVVDVESETGTPQLAQTATPVTRAGATVPDEDFFTLIMRLQSGRMEDQRATVPVSDNGLNNGTIPNATNVPINGASKKKK